MRRSQQSWNHDHLRGGHELVADPLRALAGPATDVLISLERRHVKDGDDGVDPFLEGMRANGFARTSYPAAMPVEVFRFRRGA